MDMYIGEQVLREVVSYDYPSGTERGLQMDFRVRVGTDHPHGGLVIIGRTVVQQILSVLPPYFVPVDVVLRGERKG